MANETNMFGANASIFDVATADNVGVRDRALNVAQLQPGRATVYGANLAGGMLMQNLAGMAGMKTAQQEKSELISGIMKETSGLDKNSPRSSLILAQKFMEAGLPNIAQRFSDQARDLEVKNREMNLAGDTLRNQQRTTKNQALYQAGVLKQGAEDLAFRTQIEETRVKEYAQTLKINEAELKRQINMGVLQEFANPNGSKSLYQVKFDAQGNISAIPVTADMLQTTTAQTVTPTSSGNVRTDGVAPVASGTSTTTTQATSSDALLTDISDVVDSTVITPTEETIYENLEKDYITAFSDENAGIMSGGTQLAVPSTGQYAGLTEVPDKVNWMMQETIRKVEDAGGTVNSMYDLYMGGGAQGIEAIMRNNGLGAQYEANLANFKKNGDTTLYSMQGRESLMENTFEGLITSPIMFDVKLTSNVTDEASGTILMNSGDTLEEAVAKLYNSGREITGNTVDADGNITSVNRPENMPSFNKDMLRAIVTGALQDKAFSGMDILTGSGDTTANFDVAGDPNPTLKGDSLYTSMVENAELDVKRSKADKRYTYYKAIEFPNTKEGKLEYKAYKKWRFQNVRDYRNQGIQIPEARIKRN